MSSGASTRKHRNDKQIQAIIFNMKEQRLLEKVYQSLRLEESHALKLLRLSYIDVKTNQLRIEKKVSKIHSYLTAADIAELKMLESEGKLPLATCRTSNSALRIACATQRLKLTPTAGNPGGERCQTAPGKADRSGSPNPDSSRPQTALSMPLREASSATGAARPASVTPRVARSSADASASGKSQSSRVNALDAGRQALRPVTSQCYSNGTENGRGQRRPQTAHCVLYSSHDVGKDNVLAGGSISSRKKAVDLSHGLNGELVRQREQDHRRELLDEQRVLGDNLERRRQQFLRRTAKWVDENRAVTDPDPGALVSIKTLRNRDLIRRACALGRKLTRAVSGVNEPRRHDNADDVWKDLRKCRYIRASEDQLDSSGVNTLASDHFAQIQKMKISDIVRRPRPLSNR